MSDSRASDVSSPSDIAQLVGPRQPAPTHPVIGLEDKFEQLFTRKDLTETCNYVFPFLEWKRQFEHLFETFITLHIAYKEEYIYKLDARVTFNLNVNDQVSEYKLILPQNNTFLNLQALTDSFVNIEKLYFYGEVCATEQEVGKMLNKWSNLKLLALLGMSKSDMDKFTKHWKVLGSLEKLLLEHEGIIYYF